MSRHTTGPWYVTANREIRTKADIPNRRPNWDGSHTVRWDDAFVYHEEADANLRLIATAPDLLAELQNLLFIVESVAHLHGLEKELLPHAFKARITITKATGEES